MAAVSIFLVLFLSASVGASLSGSPWLWGIGSWGIVSTTTGIVLAVLSIPLLVWRFASPSLPPLRESAAVRAARAALLIAGTPILLWIFRMRHELWGGGRLMGRLLDEGAAGLPEAPLAMLVNRSAHRFLNGVFLLGGRTTTALLSAALGLCAVLVALRTADVLLGPDSRGRLSAATAALILLGGWAALFFGAGGEAPVAALAAMLFIWASLLAVRGDLPIAVPTALLVLAVFAHLQNIHLVPGFILMTAVAGARRRGALVPALIAAAGTWIAIEGIIYFATRTSPTLALLAAFPGALLRAPDAIGSAGYWKDLSGSMLVIGPCTLCAILVLALRAVRRDRVRSEPRNGAGNVLLVHAAAALCLVAAGARRAGGGLHWDLVAPAAPALAVYAAWGLGTLFKDPNRLMKATLLLAFAGGFHLAPMIAMNASPEMAARRLLSLPITAGGGELLLGERAIENRDPEGARSWLLRAVERNPDLASAHYHLGELYLQDDLNLDAITSFQRAVELEPENTAFRLGLAEGFIAKQWFEEAVGLLDAMVASHPDSVRFWKRLGYAQNHGGLYADAIESYERAYELEPDDERNLLAVVSAVLNTGAELQREGRYEEARAMYEKAIALYPEGWIGFNNLAALEMETGDYEAAYRILERSLTYHPFVSNLNFNMGITLEKLGRDREALGYLRKSMELDPMRSGAYEHIERIEEKLSGEGSGEDAPNSR